jgi:hypothetical protein
MVGCGRRIKTVLIGGLTASGFAAFWPAPALACSCASHDNRDQWNRAAVIFSGTAIRRQSLDSAPSIAESVLWTFAVDGVTKGQAAPQQQVSSLGQESACGFEFQLNQRYQVYGRRVGNTLMTDFCSGTKAIAQGIQPVPNQQRRYNLPGNSYQSKNKLIPPLGVISMRDPCYIVGAARLIKWSEYVKVRNNENPISPNRMVWEVLWFYCNQAPPDDIRYFYEAVDVETRKRLTKRVVQSTREPESLPPIKDFGPQWIYPECS